MWLKNFILIEILNGSVIIDSIRYVREVKKILNINTFVILIFSNAY